MSHEEPKSPPLTLLLLALWVFAGAGCGETNGDVPGDAGEADSGPRISLPADEAPHSEQMEWWYYTGRLKTDTGQLYGFEFTVFQPQKFEKFFYVSHVAFTDLQKKKYAFAMMLSGEDQRKAVAKGFKLKVGDNTMEGHGGKDQIKAKIKDYALDLSLASTKPVTLQYGTGWMYVGSDKPFYYYSYTRMAASGTVTVDGTQQKVTGDVWMDHQWGTIGEGYGWDWFSLRMDDNSEVMLFKVRREGHKGFAGGTHVLADGSTKAFSSGDFTVTNLGSWTSPHTKTTYSHGWKINIPSLGLQARVDPVIKDQEFSHSVAGSPTYWEGLCDVSGTRSGKAVKGHGYVEITGKIPKL